MNRLRALCFVVLPMLSLNAYADPILGTAGSFAVLGGSGVTNTNPATNLPSGPTTITGDLGVSPNNLASITGLVPTQISGTIYAADLVAQKAQADLTTAYVSLQALLPTTDLTGQNLAGMTLTSGVYKFDSSAFLNGTSASPGVLTLNAQGQNNQFFVFQIGSTLNTSSADTGSMTSAEVQIENPGANDCVYWVVGSATIGTYTRFEGNILSLSQIALQTGATIDCGRALNQTPGPVTMDTNTISIGCTGVTGEQSSNGLGGGLAFPPGLPGVPGVPGAVVITAGAGGPVLAAVPEPGTLLLLGSSLLGLGLYVRRKTTA